MGTLIKECRLCNSKKTETLYKRQFQSISGLNFMDSYDVCVCSECGFGFASNIPEQAEFNRYYSEYSKYDGTIASESNDDSFPILLETIKNHVDNSEAEILEIGSATGNFLDALKRVGFSNITGSDPSPECVKQILQRGVQGICATIDDLNDKECWDVIIACATLEHICDLQGCMKNLNTLLKDDGLLFITVPDAFAFSTDFNPPFQEFSTEHINYFTTQSLANLAVFNGFFQLDTVPAYENRGILSVMRKKSSLEKSIKRDNVTRQALIKYIKESEKRDAEIEQIIKPYIGKPLAVWGVGTYTRHLLTSGILQKMNIKVFIDKSPHYSGGGGITLNDKKIPIVSPKQLDIPCDVPILIGSQQYQDNIVAEIREILNLENKLILLF